MLKLMCDYPELQDGHVFELGDYIYDNGMIDVFSYGTTTGRQCSGYIWNQCADELSRIPTKEELIKFARNKLKKNKLKKLKRCGSGILEAEGIANWSYGRYFYLDKTTIWAVFGPMGRWIRTKLYNVSIHKKKGIGYFHVPYPPISYFYIWIPSQEQIQDTLRAKWEYTHHILRKMFFEWYLDVSYTKAVWTDRELWIAFYMYKVHNKIWQDTQWINKRSSTI